MHSSQINNKSSPSSFTRDLETFEIAYSVLLDKAKEKYIEYDKGCNDPNLDIQRKYMGSELDLSRNLLEIFRYFIDANIMRILFNWPAQTEDPQISEKMIYILFNKAREIQLKICEIMKKIITITDTYNEFADMLLSTRGYELDSFLIRLFETFSSINMEKEIRDVIQCLVIFSKGRLGFENIYFELRQNGIMLKES